LARRLADIEGLPLFAVDQLKFKPGGEEVPHEEYLQAHRELLKQERWIIDGFGCVASAWERFSVADTLVHVDLPMAVHYWWVTKRLLKGIFVNPEGWPADSPIWHGSMSSYRVIRLCHQELTPRYRQLVKESALTKEVHHLQSPAGIASFIGELERQVE
jgi:adenylate kinase family enzyme